MARDYAKEYARRVASAEARGLSRSQARGHARVSRGELPASLVRRATIFAHSPQGPRLVEVQMSSRDQSRAGRYMHDVGELRTGRMSDATFERRWRGKRIGGEEVVSDPAEVVPLSFVTDNSEIAFENSPERAA